MTEPKQALENVPALIAERRRYEAWLAALEARRETTAKHVFDKVKADYQMRLNHVDEQLVAHRQAIEEERADSESKLSLIQSDEQLRRDQRAELELRSHVGELAGVEADKAFHAIDETIKHLVEEKHAVEGRIAELNALLEFKPSPPASREATEAAHAATAETDDTSDMKSGGLVTPGGSFDELAFLSEVVGEEERRAAQAVRAKQSAAPSAPPTQPSAPPAPVAAQPVIQAPMQAAAAPVAQPVAQPVAPPAAPPAGASRAASAPAPAPQPTTSAPPRRSFGPRREEAPESLLAGMENAPRRSRGDAPLAANVASNTPIVLKATGAVEQTKTLKCNECGALNYPTEWYCERCGAELAAL